MKMICQIYRSSRKQEMYLYVDKSVGLGEVPESLLESFGEPEEVMTLLVTLERKFARVSAEKVLSDIAEKGFFLQMPPSAADLFAAVGKSE
jgi:uncharacterized protein YcgL (UPF0745 family)